MISTVTPTELSNRLISLSWLLCSLFSYSVMKDCWKQDPDERPSFQQLLERLEQLMLQEVDYFQFDKLDESKDYYAVQYSKSEETGGSEDTFM